MTNGGHIVNDSSLELWAVWKRKAVIADSFGIPKASQQVKCSLLRTVTDALYHVCGGYFARSSRKHPAG